MIYICARCKAARDADYVDSRQEGDEIVCEFCWGDDEDEGSKAEPSTPPETKG